MLTLFRWLLRLTVALLVIGVLAVIGAWYFAIRSLPDYNADYQVTGITAPVEIVRSVENVPHIFAANDRDAFFALGLAQAQDRLWQMMVLRRAAQGRLSEIFGPQTVAADVMARRMGLYRAAQASLDAQDPQTRAALDAFADGVNQWILKVNEQALGRGAPEFFLYPETITYWDAVDSLAILNLLAAQSSTQLQAEIARAKLSVVAPKRGEDLVRAGQEPPLPAYSELFAKLPPPTKNGAKDGTPVPDEQSYGVPGAGLWANAFAAEGPRTAAGGAILANDLQSFLAAPALWYLARLNLSSGAVIGATIPGVPVIFSGRSDHLAWGLSPAGIDDQDLMMEEVDPSDPNRYRTAQGWRAFDTRRETIRIKGRPALELTLRQTVNGPVLSAALWGVGDVTPVGHVAALSWTGAKADDTTMSALMALMRAQNRTEAVAAVESVVAPAMDLLLADRDGVTQVLAGALPQRDEKNQTAGRMPVAGWRAENTWHGTFHAAPIPPENGLLMATGAARPGAGYGYDHPDGERIHRLKRLMDNREIHTRDSFIAAQTDTVSPAARRLLPLVAANLWFTGEPAPAGTTERLRQDALDLLAAWDGNMNEHLPEPLIYVAWMAALQNRLIRDELGPLAQEFTALRPEFIERVFRNQDGAGAWCDVVQSTAVETCTDMARQSLDAALMELSSRFGRDVRSWRWGDAHIAMQRHIGLGHLPGLGWVVNLHQSASGGETTLARGGFAAHPSLDLASAGRWFERVGSGYRGIYDMADPDSSVFIIATGQSGHPLSRHYDDLAELWRRGEYITMSLDPALARAGAEGVTRLFPAQEVER